MNRKHLKKGLTVSVILLLVNSVSAFSQTVDQLNQARTRNQSVTGIAATRQESSSIGSGTLSASTLEERAALYLQLAMSSPDYRVTAGDVYTLAYAAGSTPVTYIIPVDSTYRIRVSNLGTINAAGKTFTELKKEVEKIVSNNYPLSGVQLALTRPAMFSVRVRGEVQASGEQPAWALQRLSSLASANLTPYASLRDVKVKSSGGREKTYDLFKASRYGDFTQDPYLRPGDEVTFGRLLRSVTVSGEVERPGTYQLLEGEGIRELIYGYGMGFTPVGDSARVEMTRYVGSRSVSGDKIYLTAAEIEGSYTLENYDEVTVPAITGLRPVFFIEGAVGKSTLEGADDPTVSTRMTVSFNKGEHYSSVVRTNRAWFTAVSDTVNAYIIRGGKTIPINLNPMLYDAEFRSEVEIEENDTLVIPFRQYFVTVAGAVAVPGRYPYIPDRQWDYYIALAGGFVPGKNALQSVAIRDISGRKMGKSDVITPETIITARTNDFLYYFNQYAPIVTTALSIVTTFITVTTLLNQQAQ